MRAARVSRDNAKDWAREAVRGLWMCPQASFHEDLTIDEDGIRHNVDHCLRMHCGGLGYGALMEPWSETHAERMRGVEVFVDQVAGRVPTYINVTDHSVAELLRMASHALDAGATAVMFNCPYEWAKSEQQVRAFFEYVCERIDGPVFLYNTPHSGFILSPELVAELANHENVCLLKNATGNLSDSKRVVELVGDKIVVSDGFESNYLDAILAYGQQALVSSTSCQLFQTAQWQPVYEYEQFARSGQEAAARSVIETIQPLKSLWDSVYSKVRDPNHAEHPLAVTKYWQGLMGMTAGPVRPPLPQITPEWEERLVDGLRPFARRLGLSDSRFA